MKFKNIKKKVYKKKSPSNSRSITDVLSFYFFKLDHVKCLGIYRESLKFFVAFIFIVAVVVVGLDFQSNLQIRRNIDSQREAVTRDLNYWEDFIFKQQNYRDAYFQASILEYRLGNTSKAKIYAEKGLSLDPNSPDGQKLKKFLASK